MACRIGEARCAAFLFSRSEAHRQVGYPPKSRLVDHDNLAYMREMPSTISVGRRANANDIVSRNRKTALASQIFIPATHNRLSDRRNAPHRTASVKRRPKNYGLSKIRFVMAVTSSEAGSVAPYPHGRYRNTHPPGFSVAAEAGRPPPF